MKDIRYYLQFIVLACSVFFVACDDEDKETATPVFPEAQQLACAVGEEKTLTFEATDDWSLVSSALWCAFVVENEKTYSCSGTAGKQSVTIAIGDDASELMKSYRAELTLKMGGEQKVIYTVTRPSTTYEVHVFNADQSEEYTNENPFVVDFDGSQKLTVSANTDWVIEMSEGLEAGDLFSGIAGEQVTLKPALEKAYKKDAGRYKLTFKNKDQEILAEVPVNYEGIPADRIMYGHEDASALKITITADRSSFTWGDDTYNYQVPFTIMAKDNAYTLVYVDVKEPDYMSGIYEYECSVMNEEDSWFYVMDDDTKGNISISAMANDGDVRNGCLMAFPNEKYEEVKNDFAALVFNPDYGIKPEYDENVVAYFKQEANSRASGGFKIMDVEENDLGIELMAYSDQVGEDATIEEFGISNVWIASLPLGISFDPMVVEPKGMDWNNYLVGVEIRGTWGNVTGTEFGAFSYQFNGIGATVNGDNRMEFHFMGSATGGDYAILIIEPRRSE